MESNGCCEQKSSNEQKTLGNAAEEQKGARKFVEALEEQNDQFCIIGLTGKVRSGVSDVCRLLTDPDFYRNVTHPANTCGFSMSEVREYQLISRYLQHHWRPFVEVSVTSVLLSYLLEDETEGAEDETEGLENKAGGLENKAGGLKEEAKREYKEAFELIKEALTDNKENSKYNWKETWESALEKLTNTCRNLHYTPGEKSSKEEWNKIRGKLETEYIESVFKDNPKNKPSLKWFRDLWQEVYYGKDSKDSKDSKDKTLLFFFCFGLLPALDEMIRKKKKEIYTALFQTLGNNVRATGKANPPKKSEEIDGAKLFSLPERINKFVKALKAAPLLEEEDSAGQSKKENSTFVVINNFKNIFEAYYFKHRLSAFYLMAVSCDESMRQDKFANYMDFRMADLRENLSDGKKIFGIAEKYAGKQEEKNGQAGNDKKKKDKEKDKDKDKQELFENLTEDQAAEELGITPAELKFIREVFEQKAELRRKAYRDKIAPFVLQDVMTCIENSDIFVTRNYQESDYQFDYPLVRTLGRIITLILHPGLLTPTKLERCMQIAMTAKLNSGCLSRQVGAVVTDSEYNILSLGWNDAPCGVESCIRRNLYDLLRKHDHQAYSNYELDGVEFRKYLDKIREPLLQKRDDLNGLPLAFCFKDIYQDIIKQRDQIYTRALHGEERALAMCGNERAKGGYLFSTSSPCELCAKKAKEANISKIYYIEQYPGISHAHVIDVGDQDMRARYEFFVGAVGTAYVKLYTPLMPYKDELTALDYSPVKLHDEVVNRDKKKSETPPKGGGDGNGNTGNTGGGGKPAPGQGNQEGQDKQD